MRRTFSFPLLIIKGGFTLLALYITAVFLMTNLPLFGQRYLTWFIWIAGVSVTLVLIGLAHETRLTSRFIALFVKGLPPRWLRIIMDLLDGCTNKDGLLARLAAVQRAENLDATALAAAVKQKVVGQDLVADEVAAPHLPREKRRAFAAFEVFSTKAYAEKVGMERKEAFIELARSWPHYRVWTDEQGQPKGWWNA